MRAELSLGNTIGMPWEGGFDYAPGPIAPAQFTACFGLPWLPAWGLLLTRLTARVVYVDAWHVLPRNEGIGRAPCLLIWQDAFDGIELDRQVAAGTTTAAHFEASMRCAPKRMRCRSCGWQGVGVYFPPDTLYLQDKALTDVKIAQSRWATCPDCASSLFLLTLDVEPIARS